MIAKIINFIKYSYHRPTAKVEHFFTLFLKLFLNKKTFFIFRKNDAVENSSFFNYLFK